MKISNIPIVGKFLIILFFFALLSIGSTIFSAAKMQSISDGFADVFNHQGMVAVQLARANRSLVAMRAAVSGLQIANTEELDAAAELELKEARSRFVAFTDEARANDTSDRYKIGEMAKVFLDAIDSACAKSIKMGASSTSTDAVMASQAEFLKNCSPQFKPLIDQARNVVDQAVADGKALQLDLGSATKTTVQITYGLVLGGLVLVLAIAWFALKAWISTPISRLTNTMLRLADGDLSIRIEDADRHDEIGRMTQAVLVFKDNGNKLKASEENAGADRKRADVERSQSQAAQIETARQQQHVVETIAKGLAQLSDGSLIFRIDEAFTTDYEKLRFDFNGAMSKLQETMQVVSGNTAAIKSGSNEISSAADDLSRRTEQQAASLEETAAALDEITNTVRKTAQGSKHARDVVGAAKMDAEHSSRVVLQAVEAMNGIENSSSQIGQIIGVIDEIAFQTNLLALNAGVEAARAGDAGRGFAVVASEVRALAQRSADAAKEIKTLISASTAQVEQGVALVAETGKALERIVLQIAEINAIVADIAASAHEQATGLDQVNTAVNQMDQVTQQNAAMVEESTAASHALAKETEELSKLMGRFQLGHLQPSSVVSRMVRQTPTTTKPLAQGKAVRALRTVGAGQAVRKPEPDSNWQEF